MKQTDFVKILKRGALIWNKGVNNVLAKYHALSVC